MDRPTNLMLIVGVVVFETRVDFRRFRKTIADRFLAFPRFRCRARDDAMAPEWEMDPEFDLDHHVIRASLPAPAGQTELEELVSRLAGTDLDRGRPMWQFHFVDNFQGRSAAILRVHHCYADGIAMIRVLLTLTDVDARSNRERRPPRAKAVRGTPDPPSPLVQLGVPGATLLQEAWAAGTEWLGRAAELGRDPELAGEIAKHALGVATELARVALLPDDPATRLKGPLGARKIAAWAEPLPLAEVKCVARALGCSVNDLLMSTAAGALGAYLRERGDFTDGLAIRAAVPVNLRKPGEPATLGNCFGLVFLELPIGIRDPLSRLEVVQASMSALKRSYQPMLTLGLMAALGRLPGTVESAAIDLLSAKASAVATNVPGPREPLYLAGGRIARLIFWVPQSGDIGLGISILSYAGQVQFGLIADALRMPDPAEVVARFRTEFEQVVLAALLGPYLRFAR
jgi:diacylglycerol O-acyltransferase